MKPSSLIAVTLAPDLFARMRDEAARLCVPLEWLVASLVVDTMEETSEHGLVPA
jgi:hypothetical protein